MKRRLPRLPRLRLPSLHDFSHDARLLILVTGLIAVSFFGVYQLLRTLYLLRLDFGPEYVGTYLATGALTFMAMGVPSGMLGARFGTRKTMLVGGWLTVIGMGVLPFVEFVPASWQRAWPMVTQVGLTIGWSMFNVNLVPALMAVTADSNRSAAYALSSTLRSVGTFAGTLVGGMLPGFFARLLSTTTESPTPYSGALWVGAAMGLISIIPLSQIRGGDGAPQVNAQAKRGGAFPLLPVALMVLYVYLRHAGWASCQAFCNPYMDEGLHFSTSTIGLLTSVGQVASIGASLAIPALSERLTHGGLLIAVTLGLSGSLGLLAAAPHWLAVGAGLLGVLVFTAMWLPTLQIFQMETIEEDWRGLAYGAVSMAMGLGFGSMSYAGGRFIEVQGYRPLFLIGVGLTGVSSLLLAAILRARQK